MIIAVHLCVCAVYQPITGARRRQKLKRSRLP